ncbi:cysteine protease StiP domain-containing protein, partial [Clostridioides difficile]
EEGNKERELKIQNGRHYSEMIPIEYEVSEDYLNLYHEKLRENEFKLFIGVTSETSPVAKDVTYATEPIE